MNATLLDTQINSKDIKSLSKNIKDIKEVDSKDFFEQIISSFVDQVENKDAKDILLEKLLNFSKNVDIDKDSDLLSKIDINSKEQEGEVLLEDLLKLSFMLKNNIDVKDFTDASNSKELKLAVEDKKVLSDFKDAKSIKDLLDIAKKNNIKVKNFEFFKEEAISQKDTLIAKDLKSEDLFKMIENKLKNSPNQLLKTIKQDMTHKENTLKNILSTINTDTKIDHKDAKVITKDVKNDIKVVNVKQNEVFISSKNSQKELKADQIVDIQHKENKTHKDANQPSSKQLEVQAKSVAIPQEKDKKIKQDKVAKKENTIKISKDSKDNSINQSTMQNTKDTLLVKNDIASQKETQVIKNLQNHSIEQKQDITSSQSNNKKDTKEFVLKDDEPATNETHKVDHTSHATKNTAVQKHKTSDVKHTLNTFAQDFKEQVESYKPPLMKVKMQLNPKGLGEVDVTMINRGNNLHITVNSNPNTIAIFSQNQTEFKNSLVNMGFSELSMNFNENGKNKDEQQGQKNKNKSVQNFEEEQNSDSFEIVTPIYV